MLNGASNFISRSGRALATMSVFMVLSADATAQSAGPASSPRAADSARIAAQMRVARWYLPGDEHRFLARLAGSWTATVTFPGQSPAESRSLTGTMHAEPTLGDRFLVIETTTTAGSTKMDALTILGFDGRHDRFTYVGFDTFGTYYVTADGELNPAKSQLVLEGTDTDSRSRAKHFEVVFNFKSDHEFTQDIVFHREGGQSFVVLSARYVRSAAGESE